MKTSVPIAAVNRATLNHGEKVTLVLVALQVFLEVLFLSNAVLVHSCFRADRPIDLFHDGREVRFHENPNSCCDCVERVKYRERDSMLEHGEAFVITFQTALGSWIPEWREIVVTNRFPTIPKMQKITARNIAAAYGLFPNEGDAYQRSRINEWGVLARNAGRAAWRADVRERELA